MKPIVLAFSLITLVGCVESDPFGTAYLMVNNQTNESLSITFKVCYDNVDTITKCIPPQTIDTIYESDFIGSFFCLESLKHLELRHVITLPMYCINKSLSMSLHGL